MPNLSLNMLKRKAKKVSCIGMKIWPTFGEQGVNALRLFCGADAQGKVDATHGLKTIRRNVAPHELRLSDAHLG